MSELLALGISHKTAPVDARERAVTLDASVAESWDALGRARIAVGKIDDALAAWDHAIDLAPAQPAFRITPIRALVIATPGDGAFRGVAL